MKKLITLYLSLLSAMVLLMFSACQKENATSVLKNSANGSTSSTGGSLAVSTGNILVSATTTATTKDSVFIMGACTPGIKPPDTIAFSALPTAVTTYLTTNYAGYTAQKAFKITDKSGTLLGYTVVINYNGKPVGLKFDATGAFVKVLEQRERPDLNGPGWHLGGRFDDRGKPCGDTIAVSALPAAIKAYFATNYATDTLVHAVLTKDTTYIIFSLNNGMYATAFNSKLAFVKRVQVNPRPMRHVAIAETALPAAITTYLTTTYPGYVFDKAFAEKSASGTINGYVVLINANNTRYAVHFDASGVFIKAVTIK